MAKTEDPRNVYDIDKRTCALILGTNRLDDYASAFLELHCPEVLSAPMPLPVEKMLSDAKLSVQHRSLSPDRDVFGCCVLLDGEVQIYDRIARRYIPEFFRAGTLLIDDDSESTYSVGNRRNTLVHELLHWYKDKKYFELQKMRSKEADISPIMCRQSQSMFTPRKRTQKTQVEWLEWQAHRLTPRILMPKEMFVKKTIEILEQGTNSCDELVQKLSEFFIVSRISTKIRLLEVGLKPEIEQFHDFSDVYTEIEGRKGFINLTIVEAFDLAKNNIILQDWLDSYHLVFVDGYFVIPDSKYVSVNYTEIHLTNYAKKHLDECSINICEQKLHKYKHQSEDFQCFTILRRVGSSDERILAFLPNVQAEIKRTIDKKYGMATNVDIQTAYASALENLFPDDEETEKELLRLIGDEDKSLCDCLWFLIEKAG